MNAFLAARDARTDYWDALRVLEDAISLEVDGTRDLLEVTIEELICPEG
jgi:hypothetical protein